LWTLAKILQINRFWSQPIYKQTQQYTISEGVIQVIYRRSWLRCTMVASQNLTSNKPIGTEKPVSTTSMSSHHPVLFVLDVSAILKIFTYKQQIKMFIVNMQI